MKLSSLTLKNFRCYQDETRIEIDNLNVFIGKNDIGKSTIFEALEIFFNSSSKIVKIDETDCNIVKWSAKLHHDWSAKVHHDWSAKVHH